MTATGGISVVVLDDYLGIAEEFAPWDSLEGVAELQVLRRPVAGAEALVETLGRFDVACAMRERTSFPAAVLDRLPRLRLLVTTGMKNAAIDLDAATRNGIVVSGTATQTHAVVELTWALVLAVTRDIPRQDRSLREGRWQTGLGISLAGKRLGLLGLGRTGAQVAAQAQAFGLEVVAWSQNLTSERAAEVGVARVSRDELFATSDIVSVHLRLSERTRGLVGADELARMKPGAYLVNTSRGPIVDEAALVRTLEERRIAGAALDVYDVEPLPVDHPLLKLDNAVLTPHVGYVTRENMELAYGETVEDIAAFLRGEPVRVLNPGALAAREGGQA